MISSAFNPPGKYPKGGALQGYTVSVLLYVSTSLDGTISHIWERSHDVRRRPMARVSTVTFFPRDLECWTRRFYHLEIHASLERVILWARLGDQGS